MPLGEERARQLADHAAASLGPPYWRARKRREAQMLLALESIAPRLSVLELDLGTSLKALVRLRVRVPCLKPGPGGGAVGELSVRDEAVLAIDYPERLLLHPIPGYEVVRILAPRHVHLPSVSATGRVQALCLGQRLQRGMPLREIVLASYRALCLQTVTISELDPAGVLNAEAAFWWQANTALIPLSKATFLSDPDVEGGAT